MSTHAPSQTLTTNNGLVIPFYCELDTFNTAADLNQRKIGLCLVNDLGDIAASRTLLTGVSFGDSDGFASNTYADYRNS